MLRTACFILFCLSAVVLKDRTMSWKETRNLKWSDFQGEAQYNTTAAAVTASGITFSYSVRTSDGSIVSFNANVEAHFYPDNSWYIPERCNDYILKHEQLHFDITELFVRIFRSRMSQLKVTQNVKRDLDRIHREVNQELNEMQEAYDTQSDHSRNKESQAKWNAYVAEHLKKFEAFKSK